MPSVKGKYKFNFDENAFGEECKHRLSSIKEENEEATNTFCGSSQILNSMEGAYIDSIIEVLEKVNRKTEDILITYNIYQFTHVDSFVRFIDDEYERSYTIFYSEVDS
ncbi:hypothetical protein ACM6N5_10175 [Rossellomorea marisflavi]|uniref:hypothetical protein n=1 Tax=Rossellomorea marisflavi TaxID=189381 RepID=UPI003ADD3CE1